MTTQWDSGRVSIRDPEGLAAYLRSEIRKRFFLDPMEDIPERAKGVQTEVLQSRGRPRGDISLPAPPALTGEAQGHHMEDAGPARCVARDGWRAVAATHYPRMPGGVAPST